MAKTTITTDHTVLFMVEGFLSQVFTEKTPQEIITVLQKNHGINEKALYLEKGDVIQDMTQLTALFRKEKKELVELNIEKEENFHMKHKLQYLN